MVNTLCKSRFSYNGYGYECFIQEIFHYLPTETFRFLFLLVPCTSLVKNDQKGIVLIIITVIFNEMLYRLVKSKIKIINYL